MATATAKAGVALTGVTQLAEADTGPIDFTETGQSSGALGTVSS